LENRQWFLITWLGISLVVRACHFSKMAPEVIRGKKILTEAQIQQLLDPVKLTGLDKSKYQQK
jgi:hypothetical protein